MRKPEVTLRNHEAVYDYYAQYKQPIAGAYIGHKVMSLMFRPNVEYASGAEEAIEDILHEDGRLVVAVNHLSDNDQYVVSSMALREKAFRPMVGNTFIQSKEILFHHPNKLLRPVLRRGVDAMGAIPAFRKKDVNTEDTDLRRQATNRMLQTSIQKLNNGQHMAIFPEGTRNQEQPDVVQELKPGICAVLGGVASNLMVGIVPIGFTYQGDRRHPQMWVDTPIVYSGQDNNVLLADLHDSLQHSVDYAISKALK